LSSARISVACSATSPRSRTSSGQRCFLAELGDLSHGEIGEALGVRRDKVKGLVFQAERR